MNLLEVKNICKTYGSGETAVKALRNVNFSVPKGEYVAIGFPPLITYCSISHLNKRPISYSTLPYYLSYSSSVNL